MKPIKHLMFAVPQDLNDLSESHSDILWQCAVAATELAQKLGARVTLFSHVYSSAAMLDTWLQGTVLNSARDDMVKAQTARLEALANRLQSEKGIKVELVSIWGKHIDEALDESMPDNKPDLIIEPSQHHLFAAAAVRQPDEWRLIRYPDVPVILQQQTGPLFGKVLLGLDVGEPEKDQNSNVDLIQSIQKWCEFTGSELHLLNAYPNAADLMAFAPAEWTVPEIQSTLHKQHIDRLEVLAQEVGLPADRVHVGEGPVSQVVDEEAKKLKMDLVALASQCRSGVSGFFIGNTAEVILEHTRVNMLVVKPAQK